MKNKDHKKETPNNKNNNQNVEPKKKEEPLKKNNPTPNETPHETKKTRRKKRKISLAERRVLEQSKRVEAKKQALEEQKRLLEEEIRLDKEAQRTAKLKEKRARRFRLRKEKKELSANTKRILTIAIGAACAALILTFSTLTMVSISGGTGSSAPQFLVWVFIALGILGFAPYIKEKTKANLIKALMFLGFDIVLSILALLARINMYMYNLTGGLFCVSFIAGRVISTIEDGSIRSRVFNIILAIFATVLAVGLFIPVKPSKIDQIILIECLFISCIALVEVAVVAFANFKFGVLFKIVIKTFALEILFGLLATMVASALVLMVIEKTIFPTFGDSLWYCFAVVTTIGFGDFVATTILGRFITVILSVYGIVAVAVLTSIIVNFYNEVSAKKDRIELKKLEKEEAEKHKEAE